MFAPGKVEVSHDRHRFSISDQYLLLQPCYESLHSARRNMELRNKSRDVEFTTSPYHPARTIVAARKRVTARTTVTAQNVYSEMSRTKELPPTLSAKRLSSTYLISHCNAGGKTQNRIFSPAGVEFYHKVKPNQIKSNTCIHIHRTRQARGGVQHLCEFRMRSVSVLLESSCDLGVQRVSQVSRRLTKCSVASGCLFGLQTI